MPNDSKIVSPITNIISGEQSQQSQQSQQSKQTEPEITKELSFEDKIDIELDRIWGLFKSGNAQMFTIDNTGAKVALTPPESLQELKNHILASWIGQFCFDEQRKQRRIIMPGEEH